MPLQTHSSHRLLKPASLFANYCAPRQPCVSQHNINPHQYKKDRDGAAKNIPSLSSPRFTTPFSPYISRGSRKPYNMGLPLAATPDAAQSTGGKGRETPGPGKHHTRQTLRGGRSNERPIALCTLFWLAWHLTPSPFLSKSASLGNLFTSRGPFF